MFSTESVRTFFFFILLSFFERVWNRGLHRTNQQPSHALSPLPQLSATRLRSYLWEIHTERIHIQPVEETGKTLTEARQALVHQLQVHEVGLEICHRIGQLGKLWLQGIDGGLCVSCISNAIPISVGFP